mgnify:CR=1 FL=1
MGLDESCNSVVLFLGVFTSLRLELFESRNHFFQAFHTVACARLSTHLQLTVFSPASEILKQATDFTHKLVVRISSKLFVCHDTTVEVV